MYAHALYDLAKDEGLSEQILSELNMLREIFSENRDFVRLMSTPNLSKEERASVLDETFRGKLQQYLLNFLKLLMEKGYFSSVFDCVSAYRDLYNEDHGIVPVRAYTSLPMSDTQKQKLQEKLSSITGMTVDLKNIVDPRTLGGVKLDWDGRQLDDTVQHRLSDMHRMLRNTPVAS